MRKEKDNEFGWLMYYYPIAGILFLGLVVILTGYWNPMKYVKYLNSFFVLFGFILCLIAYFIKIEKEKDYKVYNAVTGIITFMVTMILLSLLTTKLGELSKEISPITLFLSLIIPISIITFRKIRINFF